jgi:hypothetical protein
MKPWQDWLWGPPRLTIQWVLWALSPWVKQMGCEIHLVPRRSIYGAVLPLTIHFHDELLNPLTPWSLPFWVKRRAKELHLSWMPWFSALVDSLCRSIRILIILRWRFILLIDSKSTQALMLGSVQDFVNCVVSFDLKLQMSQPWYCLLQLYTFPTV